MGRHYSRKHAGLALSWENHVRGLQVYVGPFHAQVFWIDWMVPRWRVSLSLQEPSVLHPNSMCRFKANAGRFSFQMGVEW